MGATFKTSESSSLYECAAECVSYKMCKSFNFDLGRGTCHLNSVDDAQYLEGSRKEADFIYSSIINWNQVIEFVSIRVKTRFTEHCGEHMQG